MANMKQTDKEFLFFSITPEAFLTKGKGLVLIRWLLLTTRKK